jgi:hypothetical protein
MPRSRIALGYGSRYAGTVPLPTTTASPPTRTSSRTPAPMESAVNMARAAHADALEAHEPRPSLGRYSVVLEHICAQRSTGAAGARILRDA